MAKVWLSQGTRQKGDPLAERPWLDIVEMLEIDRLSMVEPRPKFGDGPTLWATDVVAELNEAEAKEVGWPPGFYQSQLTPHQARTRLGLQP